MEKVPFKHKKNERSFMEHVLNASWKGVFVIAVGIKQKIENILHYNSPMRTKYPSEKLIDRKGKTPFYLNNLFFILKNAGNSFLSPTCLNPIQRFPQFDIDFT